MFLQLFSTVITTTLAKKLLEKYGHEKERRKLHAESCNKQVLLINTREATYLKFIIL